MNECKIRYIVFTFLSLLINSDICLEFQRYGALEGHSKPGLAKVFGPEVVQNWRIGLLDRPPTMTPHHLYYHGYERKYRNIFPHQDRQNDHNQDKSSSCGKFLFSKYQNAEFFYNYIYNYN
jgi:bisphosphoglycerate-dependent phosphoglycerate mutase